MRKSSNVGSFQSETQCVEIDTEVVELKYIMYFFFKNILEDEQVLACFYPNVTMIHVTKETITT